MRPSLLMIVAVISGLCLAAANALAEEKTKTETFASDPGWIGVNNRNARTATPVNVRQDFGYSRTNHAGGDTAGEIGGFVTPAAETAFYAAKIPTATFDDKLTASGMLAVPDGEFNLLLGFFNAGTVNEWRTPNTIALRINGRGKFFFVYPEFLTSKWRIGALADPRTKGFGTLDARGRETMAQFPSGGKVYKWSLTYDPTGNNGKPMLSATIGDQQSISFPDPAYLADGGTFNRFGILNVMKSYDTGGEIYIDNLLLNGKAENFDHDPKWDARGNRRTYPSTNVRFNFDFGLSDTHFAGGKARGELGGIIFRGDCRAARTMASYGDKVDSLTLDKPFHASGKLAMTRGVTDSGALLGFYHSTRSLEVSQRQDSGSPKCFVGYVIEGPSSEGFYVYPSYRMDGDQQGANGRDRDPLHIYPDGKTHDWTLAYDPAAADGRGRITVTLDAKSVHCDLKEGHKVSGTTFDRFGIVTSWIDGNSVDAYWDDITYTVSQ